MMSRYPSGRPTVFAVVVAVACFFAPSPRAVSSTVVISQVYGGGGNAGAPLTNDFVELHNLTDSPVSVNGWSIQYASATGTGNFGANTGQITELSGTIPANGYLLVQEAAGTTPVAPLPAPDVTDATPINMSGTAGKVALVNTTTSLGCNGGSTPCPAAALAAVVDLVGYGNANFFEGAGAAPTLSNTTAALRLNNGSQDTDINSSDFVAGAPSPRNNGYVPPPPPPGGCDVPISHEISAVQGVGTSTPLATQTVRVEGIVIGDFQGAGQLGGFYIQDDTPDGNPATSEGLFAVASAALRDVQVGEKVRVTGTAVESFGLTQLAPVTVVDICGSGSIAPVSFTLPRPAGTTFEPFENMLVTFPDTLTATEHFQLGRFGELAVSVGGRLFQPTDRVSAGAAAAAMQEVNDRRRLLIDDGSNVQNPTTVPFVTPGDALRLGDTTTGVTGVLTFGFGQYRLEPTMPIEFVRDNPRPESPDVVGGNVRVASFNTLNYFTTLASVNPDARGANSPEEFARQQAKEVAAILGLDADVIGLMEVENNGGAAVGSLVGALNAEAGAGTYAFVTDPVLNTPNEFGGSFGTDAIKVALIYRPATVTPVDAAVSSADPVFSRPPLIQTFERAGGSESFTIAVNHFKSKNCGGTGPDEDQGDGQGCFNALRVAQASALTALIAGLDRGNVLIVGDLNAYTMEDPIQTLKNIGYTELSELYVPDGKRYSYVFDGQSGELDHALASADLLDNVTGATIWHINADEPLILDYNTEFNPPALYAPDAYRASDHDPIIIGLTLNASPTVDAGGPYSVAEGATVTVTASGTDPEAGPLTFDWDLDGDSVFETPGESVVFSATGLDAPATRSIAVRVTDSAGLTATDSAEVTVVWNFAGFLPPVDNLPVVNRANSGASIPVKFRLSGNQGLDILASGYPRVVATSCTSSSVDDDVEEVTSAGTASGLHYDAATDTYVFVWKTAKAWAGTCRQLILTLQDGTTHVAAFYFAR